jgi:hypothetical protein
MAFEGLEEDIPGNIPRGANCTMSNGWQIFEINFKDIMITLY